MNAWNRFTAAGLALLGASVAACSNSSVLLEHDAEVSLDSGPRSDGGSRGDGGADAGGLDGGERDAGMLPVSECGDPGTTLTVPGTVSGTIVGPDRLGEAGASCWGTEGGEAHHLLRVLERQGVRITRTGGPTALSVRTDCTRESELVCAHPTTVGNWQGVLNAGEYALLLDTWAVETTPYTITAEPFEAAVNATCDDAIEIPPTGLRDQDPAQGSQGRLDDCLRPHRPALHYYVDVPPRTAVEVEAQWTGTSSRPLVLLGTGCRPGDGCQSFASGNVRPDASIANPTDATQRIHAILMDSGSAGPSAIDIGYRAMPIAAHGFCEAALDLGSVALPHREDGRAAGQREGGSGFVPDRVLYYRVTVPPLTRVETDVTVLSGESPDDVGYPSPEWSLACGGPTVPSADNLTDAPEEWILGLHWSVGRRPVDLDVDLASTELVPNTRCTEPLPVPVGTTSPVQDVARGGRQESICTPGVPSRHQWYETPVPAGAAVDVIGTVLSSPDTYAYVRLGRHGLCGGTACLAAEGTFTGSPRPTTTMTLDNRAGLSEATFVYSVTLGGITDPPPGTYQLAVELR